ncbi:MAG TPA: hypothetical protein DCW90_10320 [Lachnospiraceae bacterium]|nr:hypothetical protein [Lachnospiraceae bacterium]
MKSKKDIMEYLEEVENKVWYVRSMTHTPEQLRANGTPEDIIQGMLTARKRVEETYGTNWYEQIDDWEYSFLSGALATLRWVIDNNETDKRFLDT